MNSNTYNYISPFEIDENTFDLLDKQWMLILAGQKEKHNSMTASWGGFGILWNRPVAFIFIRPQRYTLEFVEQNDFFTLNFFDEKWRKALQLCGSKTGRELDKTKAAGLSIASLQNTIAFNEARMVIECRKLYIDDFRPDNFLDKAIIEKHYPKNDFHRLFIAEITAVYKKIS